MVLKHTPVCEFGKAAVSFSLPDTNGNIVTLASAKGKKGLLVMFVCNHCPYVKAILSRLVEDVRLLKSQGINTVAIMSNDVTQYEEDSPIHMKAIAEKMNFSFPYLYDETQQTAKQYEAICTPDFFGYNADLKLQYRGRFDDTGMDKPSANAKHDLLLAMQEIAKTGHGPKAQIPSMGCSIKWKDT